MYISNKPKDFGEFTFSGERLFHWKILDQPQQMERQGHHDSVLSSPVPWRINMDQ